MSKTATYSLIQSTVLTGNQTSITFSSIPQTFTDLVLVINAKNDTLTNNEIRFNGDTATNYSITALYGNGTSAASTRETNNSYGSIDMNAYMGTTDFSYNNIIQINDYANSTTYKTYLARANSASYAVDAIVGLWRSTAAITSFAILTTTGTRNYAAGSTFRLYGIQAGSN
jgi:hypothetical protein